MAEALKGAEKALLKNEVPVGAVIVLGDEIIAKGYNQSNKKKDATMHAEIIALKKAYREVSDWRLEGATIYITLEPCLMCLGAILNSRIHKIVYGLDDPVFGSLKSKFNNEQVAKLSKKLKVVSLVGEEESLALMQMFFARLRKKNLEQV